MLVTRLIYQFHFNDESEINIVAITSPPKNAVANHFNLSIDSGKSSCCEGNFHECGPKMCNLESIRGFPVMNVLMVLNDEEIGQFDRTTNISDLFFANYF